MNFNEINQMHIESVLRVFSRLDIENEENVLKYNVGVLDVYPYTLSEVEACSLLSSFEEHNLKYESRFIDTMRSVFQKNGDTVLVYLSRFCDHYFEDHHNDILFNFTKENETELLEIDNLADFEIIVKLSTRELFFSNFFFVNIKTVIIGNYELNFPVYCVNHQDFNWISNEATKNGLYIRK